MTTTPTKQLLGESNSFLEVLEQVSQLTQLNRPVLVVGERGTGKELIAERLHFLSDRWRKPFIKMNCAALNEELLESELFGHEAGAFTGATRRHQGRFERADGGTLFLDELATLSTRTQEKLLRFIEYGEFERLGGSGVLKSDVRLVGATNVDLPSLADANKFRHDLLDRLAFDVVTLPPLRERQTDIVLLAEHFAISMCKELGRELFTGFSSNACKQLNSYHWPGNIRELKNTVERSVYRHNSDTEALDSLSLDPFESPYRLTSNYPPADTAQQSPPNLVESNGKQKLDDGDTDETPEQFPIDLKSRVAEFEKALLTRALMQAKHNQKKSAELLSLSYDQFRGYLKKHK
jgi:psp operon transcriptional activator PspF